MNINTISIIAKEWFDKVNGNSYFTATAIINSGEANAETFTIPFSYGYGDHYISQAADVLERAGKLPDRENYDNGSNEILWRYCERKGIKLTAHKSEVAKRKDL